MHVIYTDNLGEPRSVSDYPCRLEAQGRAGETKSRKPKVESGQGLRFDYYMFLFVTQSVGGIHGQSGAQGGV